MSSDSLDFEYSSDGKLLKSSDGLEFIYDLQGLAGVVDNSDSTIKTYFYRKDAQGNIVALLDENGAVVVKYVYNAWGEHKVLNPDGTENTSASFIGNVNPFRYRGYYYDTSLKLYYLVTRYYDPVVGRFISQDAFDYADPDTINGLNLYAYCGNNPVMNVDPTGHLFLSIFLTMLIGGLVGAAISGAFNAIGQVVSGQPWNWGSFALSLAGGFVAGFIAAAPLPGVLASMGALGKVLGYGLTFVYGGVGSVAGGLITGSVNSFETAGIAFLIGGTANVLAKGISDKIANLKAGKIFNQSSKAKSLAIQKLQGSSSNMGAKALKGAFRNAFKNATQDEILRLLVNANPWFKYGILSAIESTILSGWF